MRAHHDRAGSGLDVADDAPAASGGQAPGVIRGGSWKETAEALTSDSRRVVSVSLRDDAVGLRCVLTAIASVAALPPGDFQPTAQDKIVPPGAKLELPKP